MTSVPAPTSYPTGDGPVLQRQLLSTVDTSRAVTLEPLTDDQLAYLRSELGPDTTAEEVQARWERHGDVRLVVAEVVRERLAALVAGPAQFSLSGVYSQNAAENIKALREQLQRVVAGDAPAEVQRTRTRSRRGR